MYHYVPAQLSLMTVKVSDAHAHVQKLVSVVKMATVLEECITEEQRSVELFFVGKILSTEDIHREIFPAYSGKCLSSKAVHNWAANVSLMRKS
jgi:hypothetical protein